MQLHANVTPCKCNSPGRAQSRNSSWSTAMSPRRPSVRLLCRYIWNPNGMRPRKMSASLQALTLELPGRQTTRLEPFRCSTDAHSGVCPRPVSPRGGYRERERRKRETTCALNKRWEVQGIVSVGREKACSTLTLSRFVIVQLWNRGSSMFRVDP